MVAGPTAEIICADLSCGYLDKPLLQNVNLRLVAGQTVALLGMNGSGKSTLLKTLGGDLKPLAGSVTVHAQDVTCEPAYVSPGVLARFISTVPQEEANPFAFRVLEVVAMGRLAHTSSIFDTREDLSRARQALERVECGHLAHRVVTELSGGEKQRILIARAIAQDTPLILMDEPTSHLDPQHQMAVASLISSLAEEGKCIVTAVHDLNLAAVFASRAILISDGVVSADRQIDEVLNSNELERCFQTAFERVRTESGRLVVLPRIGY